MRRTVLVSVLTLLLSVVFVPISIAEMAKEGSGTATAYYTATSVVHAQGKAYVQINYDARGVSVSESETDPFHQTSQQCVGAIKAVKGVIKEFGLCTFTRPDGDKIYVSYEATGQFGKGVKGNMTFVGGTGKCEIQLKELRQACQNPPTAGKLLQPNKLLLRVILKGRVITALLFYWRFAVRFSAPVEVLISKCIMHFGEIAQYGK
jgi:hypothetical protein